MFIIIVGSPLNGFNTIGPFYTYQEASDYGFKKFVNTNAWWVSELEMPSGH